jgi:hypothetical protein
MHIIRLTRKEIIIIAWPNRDEHEKGMLESLHRSSWCAGFDIANFAKGNRKRIKLLKGMKDTAAKYRLSILEEQGFTQNALERRHVGKVDPQRSMRGNSEYVGNRHASLLARMHVMEEFF